MLSMLPPDDLPFPGGQTLGAQQGFRTAALEATMAMRLGARHAIAVGSPTVAFVVAYRASGVPAGASVVTTSLADPTVVRAAVASGLRPRFVDVDARGQLAPAALAEHAALRDAPALVVPSHWAGHPCDPAPLAAAAPGTLVVEDAIDALGACHADGRPVGAPPHAGLTVVGIHPVRASAPAQGAVLLTDDEMLAARCRALRDERPEYRLSELHAALATIQLGRLAGFVGLRTRIAARYDAAMTEHPLATPIGPVAGASSAWTTYPLHVPAWARAELLGRLARAGIGGRRVALLLHRHPYFARCADVLPAELPATERFAAETVVLPTSPVLEDAEVRRVVDALAPVASRGADDVAVAG